MHQDQVVVKPPEAEAIATSDHCEFAAFAYKGKALSFQPHPEYSAEFMRDLIAARAGTVIPADQADAALARTGRQTDSAQISARIAEFFRQSLRKAA
jgi:GMP synthase (glutamine-hydrolysing)